MPATHPDCPDCGHNLSAWIGGGCSMFVPSTDVEVAAGAPWVRVCGHDCTKSLGIESPRDQLLRALTGRRATSPEEAS